MAGNVVLDLVRPEEYFRDKVSAATSQLKTQIDDKIEYYLVNLLCDFIDPTKLRTDQDDIDVLDTPLAIMLKKAVESAPGTQVKMYKRLGDTSLYVAGFFQGYFTRKTFDIDYYISMGSSAYSHVSVIMRDRHNDAYFRQMYQSLAADFQKLVEIVSIIAEEHPMNQKNDVNLLGIYEQWMKTQSDRLRKILEEQGIQPLHTKIKQAQ